jgi:hypothetical protein
MEYFMANLRVDNLAKPVFRDQLTMFEARNEQKSPVGVS